MARIMEAVRDYGPKVKPNPTTQLDQVADWMAMRTGLNKSEVQMVLQETNEAILYTLTARARRSSCRAWAPLAPA